MSARDECKEGLKACLETSLADAVGGNRGTESLFSVLAETCVQNDGRWQDTSHTGDACDYWNHDANGRAQITANGATHTAKPLRPPSNAV